MVLTEASEHDRPGLMIPRRGVATVEKLAVVAAQIISGYRRIS